MPENFATDFYQEIGLPICPNGDQIRSDEQGTFCWLDGNRAPAEIVNGKVRLLEIAPVTVREASPEALSTKSKSKPKNTETQSES